MLYLGKCESHVSHVELERSLITLAMSGITACTVAADRAEVEKEIRSGLKTTNLELKTLKCPDTLTPKKGESFMCDATDDVDTAGKVKVTWGEGTKFEAAAEFPVSEKLAGESLAETLSKQGNGAVTITCPDKLIFAKIGLTFSCDGTVEADKDSKYVVDFTMKDDKGNVSGKLHRADQPPSGQ
jgi:hypothetical protein